MDESLTPAGSSTPRFRFGIRAMLVAMTVLAVVLATMSMFATLLGWWFYGLIRTVFLLVLGGGLVGGAVVLRHERRAFCIAALLPAFSLRLGDSFLRSGRAGFEAFIESAGLIFLMLISGAAGAVVAYWLRQRDPLGDRP